LTVSNYFMLCYLV